MLVVTAVTVTVTVTVTVSVTVSRACGLPGSPSYPPSVGFSDQVVTLHSGPVRYLVSSLRVLGC